jgi:hypothetical protein
VIQQYNGLKYTDDHSDARWLAHLLRLGVLPEGYICPKQERAVRDLLRKRGQLVHQRTANLLSIQGLISRTTGNSINAKYIKALNIQRVDGVLPHPDHVLALKANLAVINSADAQIEILEKAVKDRVKLRPQFRFLKTVPGIGSTLAADHHARDRRDREICQCRQLCFVLSVCGESENQQRKA